MQLGLMQQNLKTIGRDSMGKELNWDVLTMCIIIYGVDYMKERMSYDFKNERIVFNLPTEEDIWNDIKKLGEKK